MGIQIQTTQALIGINRTPGKLELSSPQAVLDIQIEEPKMEISGTLSRIEIDQTQCFAESGNKTIFMLNKDNADNAKQIALANIAKVTRQGYELASIEDGGNPIASHAKENAYTQFDNEFGMVTMPKSRPVITVIDGEMDYNFTRGDVILNPQIQRVTSNYTQTKIETYLRQKNSIEINFVDEKV